MIEINPLASSSRGNCYHITDGRTPLLLECGINIKDIRRKLNFRLSGITGCLVTHEHNDHIKAVKDVMKAGINVYASPGTIEALNLSGHRAKAIRAREAFEVGTWTILPFETQHDAADPVGYLLANQAGEKLLFAIDTYYVRYKFKGLTHVMVECNYAEDILFSNVNNGIVAPDLKNRLLKSHFSLRNVKDFLRANDLSRVQEIWLLHLSETNCAAERFKREIMELTGKPVYIAPA